MKKILKIILLVVLALCIVVSAVACSKSKTVFERKDYEEVATYAYSSASKISDIDDYTYNGYSGYLALFSKVNDGITTQKIYDFANKAFVGTFTNVAATAEGQTAITYTVSLRSINLIGEDFPVSYYFVTKVETPYGEAPNAYTYSLYNAAGTEIAKTTKKVNVGLNSLTNTSIDIIRFENNLYRIDATGAITLVREGKDLNSGIPSFNRHYGDYYYRKTATYLAVYNNDLELVNYYVIPTTASNFVAFPIGEDNFFIQYLVEKFDVDSDYDFIMVDGMDRTKYDIVQKVLNVKKGSDKDIDTKYYIGNGFDRENNKEAFNGLKKKYEVFVQAVEIKDKALAPDIEAKIFAISKDGKLGDVLNDTVDGETFFQIVSGDKVLIEDKINRTFLYDYDAKLIGEVTGMNDTTKKFIITNEKIYDHDLNVVFDLANSDFAMIQTFGENVLLFDADTNTYKLVGTDFTLKEGTVDGITTNIVDGGDQFFEVAVTQNTVSNYTIYNVNGVAVTGLSNVSAAVTVYDIEYKSAGIASMIVNGIRNFYVIE